MRERQLANGERFPLQSILCAIESGRLHLAQLDVQDRARLQARRCQETFLDRRIFGSKETGGPRLRFPVPHDCPLLNRIRAEFLRRAVGQHEPGANGINAGIRPADGAQHPGDAGDARRFRRIVDLVADIFVEPPGAGIISLVQIHPPKNDLCGRIRIRTRLDGGQFLRRDGLPRGRRVGAGHWGEADSDQKGGYTVSYPPVPRW